MFKIKYELDRRIIIYKVRWLVHGYKQQESVDCNKTWTGVVKPFLFQSFFWISAKHGLYVEQINVMKAFFYGFLDEDIFVNQSEIYMIDEALVCHF